MKKIGCLVLGLLLSVVFLYAGGEYDTGPRSSRSQNRGQDEAQQQPETSSPVPETQSQSQPEKSEPQIPEQTPPQESQIAENPTPDPDAEPSPDPNSQASDQNQMYTLDQYAVIEKPLPRLVVLPFTGVNQTDSERIAFLLSNAPDLWSAFRIFVLRIQDVNTVLSQSPLFHIAQTAPLPADLYSNMMRQNAGFLDSEALALIRTHFKADYILTGHIKKLRDHDILLITLIKADSGHQIAGAYKDFRDIQDIRRILPGVIPGILTAVQSTNPRTVLTVVPFTIPEDGVSILEAETLIQLLIIETVNSGKYAVLARKRIPETALVENRTAKVLDQEYIKSLGSESNAQGILTGNILPWGTINLFLAHIFSLEDGTLRAGGDMEYRTLQDGISLIPALGSGLTSIGFGAPKTMPETMSWIPGGLFSMGSSSGEGDEQPVHPVRVNSFFLGKTPVRQKEYQAVMGTNPSGFQNPDAPVERVSWYDAVEYCNKLSLREGLTPAYTGTLDNITCNFSANGYRLPTEAEWEYAARSGNQTSSEYREPALDQIAWYIGNSGETSHEVGKKQPNSLDLYDMIGNVWEWCWDWYGEYKAGQQRDPKGPNTGTERITRGGSWNSEAPVLYATYRNLVNPIDRYRDVGFRVLRPAW
jgi:formylglycine-generating enzyme required for sulfatase activity